MYKNIRERIKVIAKPNPIWFEKRPVNKLYCVFICKDLEYHVNQSGKRGVELIVTLIVTYLNLFNETLVLIWVYGPPNNQALLCALNSLTEAQSEVKFQLLEE